MSDVIYVKYLPATDTKGARLKASMHIHALGERIQTKSVTIGYDYGHGFDFSCWKAARTLIDQLGLQGEWVGVKVATKEASWIITPKGNIDSLPSAESLNRKS